MSKLAILVLILVVIFVSKYLRQLAFGRPDSIALEITICAFIYNLVIAVHDSANMSEFIDNELMRCLALFFMAFVIAMIHHYYKEMCMKQLEGILSKLRMMERMSQDEMGEETILEDRVLEHTYLIARQSVDVWYSQFADVLFYRFLKKVDSSEEKSFKKKKSLVRWGFADILNSLPVMRNSSEPKLTDKDLNINNKSQIFGMVIFDLMQFLSLIVALRII